MHPAPARLRRRALLPVAVGLGLALAAALSPALSPAQAVTTDEAPWVPVNNRIQVVGHGFGHGHGMSQYGAQGAAAGGLGWQRIVGFYYPGTTLGRFGGRIRVLIGADDDGDLRVRPQAHLGVRDMTSRTGYTLPVRTGIRFWQLRVANGVTQVRYRTTTFHTWKTFPGEAEFFAGGRPMTLVEPGGSTAVYRGTLRLVRPAGARPETVDVVAVENYLRGVVAQEMPASWRPAALEAQAVAARTYVAWSAQQNRGRGYDICDSTACQVYGGVAAEDPRTDAAIKAVANQVLLYRGVPAFTQFSASDGGWTTAGGQPYLPAQQDPYDASTGNFTNPVHDWGPVSLDTSVLQQRYPAIGTLRNIDVVSRDGNGDWQGRVQTMVLNGSKGRVTISGATFSAIYGLLSTWFDIAPK